MKMDDQTPTLRMEVSFISFLTRKLELEDATTICVGKKFGYPKPPLEIKQQKYQQSIEK